MNNCHFTNSYQLNLTKGLPVYSLFKLSKFRRLGLSVLKPIFIFETKNETKSLPKNMLPDTDQRVPRIFGGPRLKYFVRQLLQQCEVREAKNNRRCVKAGFGGLDEEEGLVCQNDRHIIFKALLVSFFLLKRIKSDYRAEALSQDKEVFR